jgi:uncharacterized protein (TIRG00374 family)
MRRWVFWAGLAISLILLVVSLQGLRLGDVWLVLQRAEWIWIVPGIAVYFAAVGVRTWRWSYLLRPAKSVSIARLYPTVVIGYMGNNIYPARIGEILRAWVLRRNEGVPMAFSLSTVFLERIFDGLVMLGFVLIGLPRVPNLPAELSGVIAAMTALFAAGIGVFFYLALAPKTAERMAEAVISRVVPLRFRPKILAFVSHFVEGAQSLRRPTDLLLILFSTVATWLIETVKYWFILRAFGLQTQLSFADLMLVNGVANLFTIIPSGPGFVGTFDFGGIGALAALGIDRTLSAAYTLTLHAVLWLPVTALGAFFMLREGLKWADLRKAEMSVGSRQSTVPD